jgi:hypothetical protein
MTEKRKSQPLVAGPCGEAFEEFFAVFLIALQRFLDYAGGGVGGTNLFDFDLFPFELFVVLEKSLQDEEAVRREIAGFEVVAEFGIVGGDGDDFVVGGAGVEHGHDADGARLDERERLDGFLAENEDIERVVVFGVSLRDEAVVRGIENGRMDDAVDFEEAGGFVELVFDIRAERNFDDGLEITGDIFAGRNVMPCVEQVEWPRG